MKNITVAVPEDVYHAARVYAAENDTSVSAIVTAYLESLTRNQARFARSEQQQQQVMAEIERFSASDRLPRDEAHDRALR